MLYNNTDIATAPHHITTLRVLLLPTVLHDVHVLQIAAMSYEICMDMLPPLIEEHLAAAGSFEINKTLPILGGDAESLTRRGNIPLTQVVPQHLLPHDGMALQPMAFLCNQPRCSATLSFAPSASIALPTPHCH